MHFQDVVGLAGVLMIIVAYFFLQTGRMSAEKIAYSLMNAIGAAMIIYSLLFKWNLSAFVMEGTWLILSVYGMIKSWKKK